MMTHPYDGVGDILLGNPPVMGKLLQWVFPGLGSALGFVGGMLSLGRRSHFDIPPPPSPPLFVLHEASLITYTEEA